MFHVGALLSSSLCSTKIILGIRFTVFKIYADKYTITYEILLFRSWYRLTYLYLYKYSAMCKSYKRTKA